MSELVAKIDGLVEKSVAGGGDPLTTAYLIVAKMAMENAELVRRVKRLRGEVEFSDKVAEKALDELADCDACPVSSSGQCNGHLHFKGCYAEWREHMLAPQEEKHGDN